MTSWYAVTFDCAEPSMIADFWATVLGYGVADLSTADHVVLVPPDGDSRGARVVFNRVPEPKTVKNRVHLDLATTTFAADEALLTQLGAVRLADHDLGPSRWTTFQDPEGNELDLVDVTRASPGAG